MGVAYLQNVAVHLEKVVVRPKKGYCSSWVCCLSKESCDESAKGCCSSAEVCCLSRSCCSSKGCLELIVVYLEMVAVRLLLKSAEHLGLLQISSLVLAAIFFPRSIVSTIIFSISLSHSLPFFRFTLSGFFYPLSSNWFHNFLRIFVSFIQIFSFWALTLLRSSSLFFSQLVSITSSLLFVSVSVSQVFLTVVLLERLLKIIFYVTAIW